MSRYRPERLLTGATATALSGGCETAYRRISGGRNGELFGTDNAPLTGGGEVDVSRVPPIKLAELAHYGMAAKAPTLRKLAHPRRTATLLATVRHLETRQARPGGEGQRLSRGFARPP